MSTHRDAGLEALQSSDYTGAIPLLEEACQIAPEDYDSHLFLGAAYGGAGRQMDAINALTKSVQIQPANGQARYNLGVAMERAGYSDQAKLAFEQALMLQPEYAQAQQALQRLTGMSSGAQAPSPPPPPQQEQTYQPQPPAPQYGAPLQQSQQYGSPQPPAPQSGASQKPAPLYGAPQQTESAGYSPPGQPASSPLPAYGQLSQQPLPYGAPGPSIYPQNAKLYVEDVFDIKQAWNDFWMILVSPTQFFEKQTGREGMKAPLAFLALGIILISVLGLTQVFAYPFMIALSPLIFLFSFIGCLVYGIVYHLIGNLFGNTTDYSTSFRAAVYTHAPYYMLMAISGFIIGVLYLTGAAHPVDFNSIFASIGAGNSAKASEIKVDTGPQTVAIIFQCIAYIWVFILAVIGLGKFHSNEKGKGIGTAIVSWLVIGVPVGLFYLVAFLLRNALLGTYGK